MTDARASETRRLGPLVALAALVLAAVALLPGRATARDAAGRAIPPSLRILRMNPLTAQGAHFKARERVTVRLAGGSRGAARITASAVGTFTVRFAKVTVTRCTSYSVRATGSRGSLALYTAKPGAGCRPKVTVDFAQGAVVKGMNFKPRERVNIKVTSADETLTGTATANAAGSFTADLGASPLSNCSAYTIQVVGSQGSKFSSHHAAIPC